MPPPRQHSASAIASPPSATSCAERSAPERTPWRTAACSARSSPRSACGSSPAIGSPRSLASSEPAAAGAQPAAISAIASPSAGEAEPARAGRVGQLADHADDRRRVDRAAAALVVERDVAAHDRHAERAAGVAEPGHRAGELPGDVRLLGVAEVQAVGQPERLGARAGEVGRALEHRLDGAAVGVDRHAAAVAVDRDGDRRPAAASVAVRASSTAASACSGRRTVREPTMQSYCSNAQRREARLALPSSASSVPPASSPSASVARGRRVDRDRRRGGLEVVGRALVDERADRQVADQRRRRRSTRRRPESVTSPIAVALTSQLVADRQHLVDAVGLDHAEHPLLGLGDHDLERLHVGLAQRHAPHVEVDPDLALGRHLRATRTSGRRRRGPAARRAARASSSSSEHSSSFFSSNGSPIWTVGRLSASRVAELGAREHGRAADPVAARARAEQHDHVADAGGGRADQLVRLDQADAHRVDEAVLLVGALEVDLAADRGHADRVAVVADARRPRARAGSASAAEAAGSPKRSESRIAIGRAPIANTSRRIPPTPVAAPWNGSTALGWLCDSTLNAQARSAADGDRARVLARPEDQRGPSVGSVLQQPARVLVAAVLGPHQARTSRARPRWARARASRRSARTRRR